MSNNKVGRRVDLLELNYDIWIRALARGQQTRRAARDGGGRDIGANSPTIIPYVFNSDFAEP